MEATKVQSVEVRVGKLQAAMLRHSSPQSALDAKFSAQFAMASAVLRHRVGLNELRDEFVRSEPVQQFMRKVRVSTTDEADPDEPLFAPFDFVTFKLEDGSTVKTAEVRYAKGHARNPIGLEELRAKFDDCTGGRRGPLFETLLALESLPNVSKIGV
jgi:2-methylcitrate dehydratase PrpD